jgi:hypothetical protein
MGYTTTFEGEFELDRVLDEQTDQFLNKLATTRRTKRQNDLLPKSGFEKYGFSSWGVEGEFYVDGSGSYGQGKDSSVVDYNGPPSTQPGLWCQWVLTEDKKHIVWDDGEKFYNYIEWLEYIISSVLIPRKYVLNGIVDWEGEEHNDFGQIKVENNCIFTRLGKMGYGEWK